MFAVNLIKLQPTTRHFPTAQQRLDLARVDDVEDDHDAEHEHGVEGVQEPLVGKDVAVVALDKLDDAEGGSDQDEEAGGVEGEEVFAPGDVGGGGGEGGGLGVCFAKAGLEEDGNEEEAAEEDDLHEEATDDDVLAELDVDLRLRRHQSATCMSGRSQ